jgi:hypothetical protein
MITFATEDKTAVMVCTKTMYLDLHVFIGKLSGGGFLTVSGYDDKHIYDFFTSHQSADTSKLQQYGTKYDTIEQVYRHYTAAVERQLRDALVGYFNDDTGNFNPSSVVEEAPTLKCVCFYCQVELTPNQYYRYDLEKYEIVTKCQKCDRLDKVILTAKQIKDCNEQGAYQSAMGK